ncbi:hypothetical protein GGTG_04589 [Gaeumannomyces tritici R3-111a-1]|uniref:Uncharacterized protein n=1 Tax=Gaeumannomyces tritici (strain R3-111a-1) TaxID=644352 RepID=J3NTI9_GAET3|nr:hypothetical protein GGTG_04589 [Gaeumannomyces tritici R3-111a-1]EJT79505.1 hypothetical protein GGTG_04589 [Gaeumannomyces tritici R3-111a-1]
MGPVRERVSEGWQMQEAQVTKAAPKRRREGFPVRRMWTARTCSPAEFARAGGGAALGTRQAFAAGSRAVLWITIARKVARLAGQGSGPSGPGRVESSILLGRLIRGGGGSLGEGCGLQRSRRASMVSMVSTVVTEKKQAALLCCVGPEEPDTQAPRQAAPQLKPPRYPSSD